MRQDRRDRREGLEGQEGREGLEGRERSSSPPDHPDRPDRPDRPDHPGLSRRDFLSAALLAPTFTRLQARTDDARFLAVIPFGKPGVPVAPLNRVLGAGLDARAFTDLGELAPDRLVTRADRFFVRTAAAATLPPPTGWTIEIGGLVDRPATIDLPSLERLAHASGRYLVECAGNADPNNYGLMSVADWEGAPLLELLDRVRPSSPAHRILVSGFDDESVQPRTSIPGASWIFPRDDLKDAMLALRMNGGPLARDHGAPVRLVVPGWYGCACIKWVNRIELVPDEAAPTSQMWEFANRTQQPFAPWGDSREVSSLPPGPRPPARARDYIPAIIDTAATPIRIEKWRVGSALEYRIVGIIWGGSKPTNALAIRFRTSAPWIPVDSCPLPADTRTWSLWTHTWKPDSPGKYEIVLKVTDPSIRTRRLDLFYYVREVTIEEI